MSNKLEITSNTYLLRKIKDSNLFLRKYYVAEGASSEIFAYVSNVETIYRRC